MYVGERRLPGRGGTAVIRRGPGLSAYLECPLPMQSHGWEVLQHRIQFGLENHWTLSAPASADRLSLSVDVGVSWLQYGLQLLPESTIRGLLPHRD